MSETYDARKYAEAVRFALRRAQAQYKAAGSGNSLDTHVETVRAGGGATRVRVSVTAALSNYAASYNARTGECLSWFFESMMEGLDQGAVPESECLLAARAAAQAPQDAVLERCGFVDIAGAPAFEARWRHVHEGLPVEGDFIVVRVNGRTGQPYSFVRRWHAVDEEFSER